MKKLFLTVITAFALCGLAPAQQLTPATISSCGGSKSAGNVLLEDNLGGLMVSTISTPTFMYTEGFLQPDVGSTTVVPPYIVDVTLSSGSGIDNAGTTFINGGVMLEFTVGEFVSKTLSSANNLLTQGILQPFNTASGGPLPVTGLEPYASRIDAGKVQLDWKTLQEINNKGFHIERRYENESNFTAIDFVASAATGGNSSFPLQYKRPDANNFTGKTYYRIKQEDIDGRSSYSVIRVVAGSGNKQVTLQVWPVPATGPVNVLANGLTKTDMLLVYDMNGKLVKQQALQNNNTVQLTNLIPGTYMVRLAEHKDLVQKIVVQ